MNIIIVAEDASARFGGEAILPLHYYRFLKEKKILVKLIVHERNKHELTKLFPEDNNIYYCKDTSLHKILWKFSRILPQRVSEISFGFIMHILTQSTQKKIIKRLVKQEEINLVHQPTPVSPKEPSTMFNLGVPVIIGPLNGGMDFPSGFQYMKKNSEKMSYAIGRNLSPILNFLIPGKRKAKVLLVANERTRGALPKGVSKNVIEIVENGVDLDLWSMDQKHRQIAQQQKTSNDTTHFVFMGRLVDWKAVDILLEAFRKASSSANMSLTIIGDGEQREYLEELALSLELTSKEQYQNGKVSFWGWLPQKECSNYMYTFDALVLPSVRECGGAVVLEAMAKELPVIATAWGGPLDYLDSSCGILIDGTSPKILISGLAEAMIKLCIEPQLRIEMGLNGRKKITEMFDWKKKIETILEIYKSAIE